MAKNGLFISKEEVERLTYDFCQIKNIEVKNENTHQTRYFLEKDGEEFFIDVYFRNDKTCTISTLGNETNRATGQLLKEYIISHISYTEEVHASFTIIIENRKFDDLVHYLEIKETVLKVSDENKGDNGRILKFTTNFGDRAVLTYYGNTGTMRYQGLMMDLYVEVKSFVTPLGNQLSNIVIKKDSTTLNLSSQINSFISTHVPNYYTNTDNIMQEFIEDSIKMLLANGELNDYAVWTTPILRVLEHRIKAILGFNDIIINDKRGFKTGPNYTTFIFDPSYSPSKLNISIAPAHEPCLISCYDYWKDNRHQLFHANQLSASTRLIPCPSDAQGIIIEVCKRLEHSYVIMGQ